MEAIQQQPQPLKLDLGCGPHKHAPDFIGVDRIAFTGVDIALDLAQRWPWEANTVDEVFSSHLIEHFTPQERVHFFNELWRVLKVGAKALIIAPHWSSCRAYGDPTHCWPPVSEFALFYLNRKWRMENAPHTDAQHWPLGYVCHFDATWSYSLEPGVAARNQEYQQYAMVYLTEARQDMLATLTKVA